MVSVLRTPEIQQKLGIGNTTYWQWVKLGKLPKPRPIVPGGRAVGTPESEIDAVILKPEQEALRAGGKQLAKPRKAGREQQAEAATP